MPIELLCQGCGQQLRVGDEHAGKRARCPKCQHINPVPESSEPLQAAFAQYNPAPFSEPSVTTAVGEAWRLQLEDGRNYGPVSRAELDRWFQEGRISPRSRVMSDRTNTWQWASEIYPVQGVMPTMTAQPNTTPTTLSTSSVNTTLPVNPFGEPALNPYASPTSLNTSGTGYHAGRLPAHRGGAVLALSVCGFFVCPLLSLIAIIMGHQDLAAIRAGRMDPEGQSITLIGLVLGYVVLVPMALFILMVFLAIAVHAA